MKSALKYLPVACFALLAACTEVLDTKYEGGIITEDQKKEANDANPALFDSDVNSMYALMSELKVGTSWTTTDYHYDFGMAAIAMMMESNGQDFVGTDDGYNWFSPLQTYEDRIYEGTVSRLFWTVFYKQIRAANVVIAAVPEDAEEGLLAYRGQALAFRAYNYWNLAQLYQFTYKGNESKPCVPIVTEATVDGNNPRKTVQEVYDFILADLSGSESQKGAIELLEGATRSSKMYIDQAVAYGIRARVNLVMQSWAVAAADAAKALELSGAAPYTRDEVSKPTFNTANAKSVMWANLITPNNDVVETGIVNWPSHMCSFSGNGYTSVGAVRSIASLLYSQIPVTDVRRGWWFDEKSKSPLVAGTEYDEWRGKMEKYIVPLVNVKFGAYEDKPLNSTNAQDWILMRAEEMLLIQAEATAMSGDEAGGRKILEDFVKTYRNPSYTSSGDVQEAVWQQRRVELWGEGFAFFDIMRLRKPIIRVGSSYAAKFTFDIPAEDNILLRLIPLTETESNKAIKHPDNNNAVAPKPTPVG